MSYQLADKVSFCIAGDRVVFHDLKSDAYVSLEKPESVTFSIFAATGAVEEADLFDDLASAGLLTKSHSDFRPLHPVVAATPDRSAFDYAPCRVPANDILAAVLHQYSTAVSLRFRPLHAVIGTLRRRHDPKPDSETRHAIQAIDRAARAFELSTRFIASSTKCLRRSIALHRYLSSRGIDANLVVGVKVNAFGAHCWVQYDTTVLNDSLENVLRYTPVMVV